MVSYVLFRLTYGSTISHLLFTRSSVDDEYTDIIALNSLGTLMNQRSCG